MPTISPPLSHREDGIDFYTQCTCLVSLSIIVIGIGSCVSIEDLGDDDANNPAVLDHHALNISSAPLLLDDRHSKLPLYMRFKVDGDNTGNIETFDFALPVWL